MEAESALSMLLGASAACLERSLDATTVRLVFEALEPLARVRARIVVEEDHLRTLEQAAYDPVPNQGLCIRLRRIGVSCLGVDERLQPSDVENLLSWVGGGPDFRSLGALGLTWSRPARRRDSFEIAKLATELGVDPETGINNLSFAQEETERERPKEQVTGALRNAVDRLRDHLGVARMASVEAELRKSLQPDALAKALDERKTS